MDKKKGIYTAVIAAGGMFLMILDAKTAIQGAADGLEICIKTIIPSLFPFFCITKMITASCGSFSFKFLRPFGRLCKIPPGSEIFLFLGWFGGYPIGAQVMESAVKKGSLDRKSAERMMGFCNNPGPAFLFGITGLLFDSPYIPWIIWAILIFSALLTGMLLPEQSNYSVGQIKLSKSNYMTDALKSMATVCGWIITFRILLSILNRWILWMLPVSWQILLTGILEISNGCLGLNALVNPAVRFTFAAVILSLGGLCVAMQAVSVSPSLNHKYYFIGKLIQMIIVIPLSQIAAFVIFRQPIKTHNIILLFTCIAAVYIYFLSQRNQNSLTKKCMFDNL